MKTELIIQLHQEFEQIVQHHEETQIEFWLARDLQPLLGYKEWRNFAKVIDKAKESCSNAGYEVRDHFVDVNKMVQLGSGAEREVEVG
ncbi:hypothetical protein K8I31_09535 [bacterium]|nr:hypothetical protein [bacterium]